MTAKLVRAFALVVAVAFAVPAAVAQEVVATPPASRTFALGALQITVLRDGSLAVANDGSVFGLNASPDAVAAVLREAGAPTGTIHLDIDALLIRMPAHLVLVDTGYGREGHGVLKQSLAAAGVSPADITDIFITHSHPDHVGGLVDPEGRSAFPRATIHMSAREWEYMQHQHDAQPIAAAVRPQVKTFEPGHSILPGIKPIALYGHTPGHVAYEITSQGRKLLDIGDTAHSSIVSLAKPDWTIEFDADRAAGARLRRETLARLAASHELVFAGHFPFPGVGRVVRAGDGFRFVPEVPNGRAG
jgi:glyoxylase-like metal-dependent hydrolase (beta-lactamase superfamily II)